jgi:hypothetical protein
VLGRLFNLRCLVKNGGARRAAEKKGVRCAEARILLIFFTFFSANNTGIIGHVGQRHITGYMRLISPGNSLKTRIYALTIVRNILRVILISQRHFDSVVICARPPVFCDVCQTLVLGCCYVPDDIRSEC